ncbi:HNH endonuclease [Clostridium sp. MSJ-8]|uniref:HNH endonuclease n=1 Tax=Clostridium sp. MSJ-8 TaxID=2841510 RepID=UPI001C0E9890|nr:HNH endonuclease signature motif containing protein [Clostridium sp. MSJ-8]MBU5488516.1 HNH endonuclease [Clostridium sp. MSJ-8]
MHFCEICNREADIHHIVHRHEGGLDIQINYMYLCQEHHRGKNGPHKNIEVDIEYKIRLQNKLNKLLPKPYYTFKELCKILNISINTAKKITKNMKLHKEGYDKTEVILFLMGGKSYTQETLEAVRLEKLF